MPYPKKQTQMITLSVKLMKKNPINQKFLLTKGLTNEFRKNN